MRNPITLWTASLILLLTAATAHSATGTISAGTTIAVRLLEAIDSETNYVGQTIRATVDAPLTASDAVLIPKGAEAIGRIVAMEQAGRFRGRTMVALELTAVNFDGQSLPVQTSWHQELSAPRGKATAVLGGVGSLLGSVVGAVAGGTGGMLLGAGAGVAGGAAVGALRRPKQVQLPQESLVIFTLQSPISISSAP